MNDVFQVVPNRTPHVRGSQPIRAGYVEANEETEKIGIDGYYAVATHEEDGWVRVYLFMSTPMEAQFPNVPLWIGPYTLLSEEVTPLSPP